MSEKVDIKNKSRLCAKVSASHSEWPLASLEGVEAKRKIMT